MNCSARNISPIFKPIPRIPFLFQNLSHWIYMHWHHGWRRSAPEGQGGGLVLLSTSGRKEQGDLRRVWGISLHLPGAGSTVIWGPESLEAEPRTAGESTINARVKPIRKGMKPLWPHSNTTLRNDDKFWDKRKMWEIDLTVELPDLTNKNTRLSV